MIKQNIFEFSSESRVHENEHSSEKAQCVSWFIETKSDIQVQRNFRRKYGKKATCKPLSHHRDINDLQHRMIKVVYRVTVDMLARTWQEIKYR